MSDILTVANKRAALDRLILPKLLSITKLLVKMIASELKTSQSSGITKCGTDQVNNEW